MAPHEEDEQENNSPFDSGWQRNPLAKPYPAMDRESRANPPQGRPAPTKNYMGMRSARFEQMDVDCEGDTETRPLVYEDTPRQR